MSNSHLFWYLDTIILLTNNKSDERTFDTSVSSIKVIHYPLVSINELYLLLSTTSVLFVFFKLSLTGTPRTWRSFQLNLNNFVRFDLDISEVTKNYTLFNFEETLTWMSIMIFAIIILMMLIHRFIIINAMLIKIILQWNRLYCWASWTTGSSANDHIHWETNEFKTWAADGFSSESYPCCKVRIIGV